MIKVSSQKVPDGLYEFPEGIILTRRKNTRKYVRRRVNFRIPPKA